MSKYAITKRQAREDRSVHLTDFADDLDALAREGTRRMLVSTLDAEVTEFLGRGNPISGRLSICWRIRILC